MFNETFDFQMWKCDSKYVNRLQPILKMALIELWSINYVELNISISGMLWTAELRNVSAYSFWEKTHPVHPY